MIDDAEAERCLRYLRESAKEAARAGANRYFVIEYRKIIKAKIMQEHSHMPLAAQEREAYADPRYEEHLQAIARAIEIDDEFQYRRAADDRTSSVYQSLMKHL